MTIVINIEGLSDTALKKACNTVANFVSDGNAAHGSSASVMNMAI
jgi:hypothetical protein